MAQTLPIVQSADSYFGGTHTRNRKIPHRVTCETCPGDRKRACSLVCPEMERYLAANGRIITHNSPTQKQACQPVEEMTGAQGEQGRSLSKIRRDNPHVTVTQTPESLLTEPEHEQAGEARVLTLIAAYCAKEAKGNRRKRSILESAIVLCCLERYSVPRVCEMLEARFSGFGGYTECIRKTGRKAGSIAKTPKSAHTVRRIVQRFARNMRDCRLP
jgi:hypothetical protein